MESFVNYLPERVRRPMYDEDEWPHDPLNMAIMLACFYVLIPLVVAGSLLLATTDWDERVPIWLDFPMGVYLLVIGWIVLDEWRSRRRSTDGKGHGWIWQMVQRYGPRRLFNRLMVALLLLAIIVGRGITYIDRFVEPDLQAAHALLIAEAAIRAPIAVWAAAAIIGWRRACRRTDQSIIYRSWLTTVFCLSAAITVSSFGSASDELPVVARLLFIIWALLFFPGWAISALADRIRNRTDPVDESASAELVRPDWW